MKYQKLTIIQYEKHMKTFDYSHNYEKENPVEVNMKFHTHEKLRKIFQLGFRNTEGCSMHLSQIGVVKDRCHTMHEECNNRCILSSRFQQMSVDKNKIFLSKKSY